MRYRLSNLAAVVVFTSRRRWREGGPRIECSLCSPGRVCANARRRCWRRLGICRDPRRIRLEGRTHLSQRAAGRWLASLGDDNIVDLLTAVTPIRARTTTLCHDNSSSEPHRSRNEAISVHADEAWTAAACNKVHITAADRRDDHVPTTATYTKIRCGPTSSRRSSSRRTV